MTDHPDGIAERLREIQGRTPQERWALACKMSVDIAGRVARGADLSIEMAEAFKGLLDLLTARSTDGIEGLIQRWDEQAANTPDVFIGLNYSHGIRLTLRSCADALRALVSRSTRGGMTTTKDDEKVTRSAGTDAPPAQQHASTDKASS